jgi:hypothetical protein
MAQPTQNTNDELVFKPVYPGRIRFTLYLYPLGILACISFIFMAIYSRTVFPNLIYAFIFGFTLLTVPMILFREVRFGEVITLKSWFRPRRIIRYEDVVSLTPRGLVAKHGGIPLVNVQNRAEFEKIIRKLANQRKIKLTK